MTSYHTLASPTGKWTLLATILASSMAFIDSTALNVILPSLQGELAASGSDIFWVLNSYLLMLAALIIVGGSLGDKLGRVKVFSVGVGIFTLSSILCGFSPSIDYLIVFRGIQGIGGALMIPGSLAIISAVFDKKEKGKAIGTWSAATTIVTICGPVMGGALADAGLWRFIFYLNVPLGIFCLYLLQSKVPESRELGASKIDWLGASTLVISLASITFGCLEMPELGTQHPLVLGSVLLGIAVFILFLFIENRVDHPMVPLTLFKSKTFSGINLLSFFLYGALGGLMLFLSLNIIQIQGYSQLQAGLTFLPFSITMVFLARKMGSLTDKYGARRFLIIGPLLTAIGMFWLSSIGLTAGPTAYWTTYFPGFIVFAVGMSITVVPLTTAVMSCVDDSQAGIASGINNSVTRIAGTFMNAILGAGALYLFTTLVSDQLDALALSDTIRTELLEEAKKLGEAKALPHYSTELQAQIKHVFTTSFMTVYKWVGWLCTALATLSALIALLMVAPKRV